MKYFDMFSGAGGFCLGIERAYGMDNLRSVQSDDSKRAGGDNQSSDKLQQRQRLAHCVGFSEIDKYASAVLKYRFPNVRNYGDAWEVPWEEVPDFDLLVAGFPCQSWSIAGKRGGFDDRRGNLFFAIIRCIEAKKPPMLLLENVAGILSHDKGKSFEKILEELCARNYAVDFDLLNAKNYGVPQNRNRCFIVCKRLDTLSEEEII